jgi:tetratricopeptide (TPR) repeat protein
MAVFDSLEKTDVVIRGALLFYRGCFSSAFWEIYNDENDMKQKWFFLLVSAAWLMLGCTGGEQYAQVLDRAERQNQNWDSITGIDSIQMAVKYVDRHGSSNEKVRAHYLLGCAYRDAGEAPNALEAFHEAADRADTTSMDCDYGLLMKVHAQSSELFRYQLLPYEMLEELEAQRRCAIKAGNTKAAINAIERSAEAYQLLNMPDSIILFRMRASTMYEQCGFTEEAAQTLSPCIEPLVDRGDTAEARRCIERYESSKNFFKDGELLPRKLVHYYSKGKYYLATNQTDSAEVCFRKLIKPGLNPQQLEAGYRGMFLLYRQKNKLDSVAKYADLQYEQVIPALAEKSKENIQQMQRLYNYSRIQREAKKTAEKSEQQEGMILILVVAAIVLALIVFGIIKILRIILKRPRIEKLADQIVVSNEGRVMYG